MSDKPAVKIPPGHKFEWVPLPGKELDQIKCECGWESRTYYDGAEYAFNAWIKHVQEAKDQ